MVREKEEVRNLARRVFRDGDVAADRVIATAEKAVDGEAAELAILGTPGGSVSGGASGGAGLACVRKSEWTLRTHCRNSPFRRVNLWRARIGRATRPSVS